MKPLSEISSTKIPDSSGVVGVAPKGFPTIENGSTKLDAIITDRNSPSANQLIQLELPGDGWINDNSDSIVGAAPTSAAAASNMASSAVTRSSATSSDGGGGGGGGGRGGEGRGRFGGVAYMTAAATSYGGGAYRDDEINSNNRRTERLRSNRTPDEFDLLADPIRLLNNSEPSPSSEQNLSREPSPSSERFGTTSVGYRSFHCSATEAEKEHLDDNSVESDCSTSGASSVGTPAMAARTASNINKGSSISSRATPIDTAHGYMNLRNKSNRRPIQLERNRPKRQTTRNMCRPLKQWLYGHRDTPYPTKPEKLDLAKRSNMTLTQVSNWFANARRRLKNTVSGQDDITWARRIKLYNRNVVGNQELLSISSEDTMWDDDTESLMNVEEEEESTAIPRDSTTDRVSMVEESNLDRVTFTENPKSPSSFDHQHSPILHYPTDLDRISTDITDPVAASVKFKQSILHRYLTDTYEHRTRSLNPGSDWHEKRAVEEHQFLTRQRHPRNEDRGGEVGSFLARHRNTSGSLSSHDYEEMSLSSRSTPTKEQHSIEDDFMDASSRLHHQPISGQEELYLKEISAVLVLTRLARSRLNSTSSFTSSRI